MNYDEQGFPDKVVLDTNILIAAGFKQSSHSATLVRWVREGRLRLIWNRATRGENEQILRRIPVLPNDFLEGLYREEDRWEPELDTAVFAYIEDPADRKFAALAVSGEAVLVSADQHLLRWRDRLETWVLRPGELVDREDS